MKPSTEWWRYLAPLAVIAIIALLPLPAGLESHTWLYFAVFTGVIVGLILEPVPGAVVAMVGISIIAILSPWLLFSPEQLAQPGFKFTAKSLSWAVSGFSNSVIWLIFILISLTICENCNTLHKCIVEISAITLLVICVFLFLVI